MNKYSSEETEIRNYRSSDLNSLYDICILTGKSGKDATKIYKDHDLLGHYYVGPYTILEPELIFILTFNSKPSGYILGALDSTKFYENCERKWFPEFREKYKLPIKNDLSPEANIIRLIHKGHLPKSELLAYHSHLHINLLPIAQGKGLGGKLMRTFIYKLKELNSTSLHLEVGKKNVRAITFYSKVGFHIIREYEYSIAFGIHL